MRLCVGDALKNLKGKSCCAEEEETDLGISWLEEEEKLLRAEKVEEAIFRESCQTIKMKEKKRKRIDECVRIKNLRTEDIYIYTYILYA